MRILDKMTTADDLTKYQHFIHDSTWGLILENIYFSRLNIDLFDHVINQHIQFDKNVGDLIIFSVDVSLWNERPLQK